MMYRKFIAIVLGTAIAITGITTAPARAGDRDFLKVLGGVAALAIIGSAIANNKNRNDHVTRQYDYYRPQTKPKHHGHKYGHKHGYKKGYKHGYRHGQRHGYKHGYKKTHRNDHYNRPLPNRVQQKLLPASCRVQARNRHGNFLAYSDWCLDRKYRYSRSLPRNCAVRARVLHNNRHNVVYGNRCLSRYGYAAARY